MQKKLTINLDSELMNYTAKSFGYKNDEANYSDLVEKVLLYFLKPQFELNKNLAAEPGKNIQELLEEPEFDINTIEEDYSFDLSTVEGKWPGNEPIELLLNMLK